MGDTLRATDADDQSAAFRRGLESALGAFLEQPRIEAIKPFGTDVGSDDSIAKVTGYGKPILIRARDVHGHEHAFVFHTARADRFGHDRRADRAAEMLLGYDTFSSIPRHAPAVDVGAVTKSGSLISLRDGTEFYLLTGYVPGRVYAEEMRALAQRKELRDGDVERCRALADYLVDLHREPLEARGAYERAVRDLVGSGEGIFGILDSYPADTPGITEGELRAIERSCVDFRWRLRSRAGRLRRIHGDFHPFNILFDESSALHLLDASRGSLGEPADDVACLAINYVFFALCHPGSWHGCFERLWFDFWRRYLEKSGDDGLLAVTAPFFAWRALVLSSPAWYSGLPAPARTRLLGLCRHALTLERFDPGLAQGLFP
ncbi:MAG TPA: phosphotransferase [Polyangiaceae bacterium]|jgi:hypothetical protein